MSRGDKIRWLAPWEGEANDPDVEASGYIVMIVKHSKEKETTEEEPASASSLSLRATAGKEEK